MKIGMLAIALIGLAACNVVNREEWANCRVICGEEPKWVKNDGACGCEKYGAINRDEVKRRIWLRDQKEQSE